MTEDLDCLGEARVLSAQELRDFNRAMDKSQQDMERKRKEGWYRETHPNINCPVCGSETATARTQWNGIVGPGSRLTIIDYRCDGCSTAFTDPKKFSAIARRKKRKKSDTRKGRL